MNCPENSVIGDDACTCSGNDCKSAAGKEKACVKISDYSEECVPVIKDGYTTTATNSACATAMTEGTPAYFAKNKACKNGVLSDIPNCNGGPDTDVTVDPKNPAITSPKETKQCICGGGVLDDHAEKCYTDPKGNSDTIDVCNANANTEACLCGTDSKVALKYDYCDAGTIKKGCMNEDDKCTKTSTTKCTVKSACSCGGKAATPNVAAIGGTCNGNSYTAPIPTCDITNCTPTVPSGLNCEPNSNCKCGDDNISSGVCVGYASDSALKKCHS